MIDKLYGDYVLLIDRCFDGDQDLKDKVAFADRRGRGGSRCSSKCYQHRKPTLTTYDESMPGSIGKPTKSTGSETARPQEYIVAQEVDVTKLR
jgi:hypothetical protein